MGDVADQKLHDMNLAVGNVVVTAHCSKSMRESIFRINHSSAMKLVGRTVGRSVGACQ